MSVRTWGLGLCAAFVSAVLGSSPSWAKDADASLVTPQGELVGTTFGDGTARVFKGIPYAAPPIGPRRWTAARPASGWVGVRDARVPGPICMQTPLPKTLAFGPGKSQPVLYADPLPHMSEDCLYLNVWTPALATGAAGPKPVMVWIHGGAFTSGAGSSETYDARALAAKGVVVVTINYRLGVFGFFAHPELSAEPGQDIHANFGITDQVEALKWVKANIATFGGDPSNVTIFGESAGSWAVSILMASPLSNGLFHKAIGESGAYFYSMADLKTATPGRPSAETIGRAFGDRVAPGGLAALRNLSAEDLLVRSLPHFPPNPDDVSSPNFGQFVVVDGKVLEKPVRETFALGEQHAVPVMVGFNSDEGSGLSDFGVVAQTPADSAAYEAAVQKRFGDLTKPWLAQYPSSNLTEAVFNAYRDSEFGWRMEHWANRMSAVKAPAWLYFFSHVSPTGEAMRWVSFGAGQRRLGAFHASEIPYVFDHPALGVAGVAEVRPGEGTLADTMSDYWVSFARTGNPNGAGRPDWSPYVDTHRAFMQFDRVAHPGVNLQAGSLELHRRIDELRTERGLSWDGGQAGLLGHTQ